VYEKWVFRRHSKVVTDLHIRTSDGWSRDRKCTGALYRSAISYCTHWNTLQSVSEIEDNTNSVKLSLHQKT